MEINNYINFRKMFFDLYEEQKNTISSDRIENNDLGLINEFVENSILHNKYIIGEECDLNNNEIIFIFINENNTTPYYYFIFDRILDVFTNAEYIEE